jgi:hypothetical protein
MIITLKTGADVKQAHGQLTARGLWVTRLEGGGGVQFTVERHSRHLGPEEIAQACGTSYNTVRSRLHHARLEFTAAMRELTREVMP